MEKIKFRAWHFLDQEIKRVNYIDFGNMIAEAWNKKSGGWDSYKVRDRELVLMQFTGLKDKNGKDIYEGDIINDFGGGEGSDRIGFVIFSEEHGAFMFDGFCGYPYFVRHDMANECEVIGNIFENKELLKQCVNHAKSDDALEVDHE